MSTATAMLFCDRRSKIVCRCCALTFLYSLDFHIKKNFLKRSERLYGTKPVNLKQNMQHNLEAINKWVKDATKGRIPNFLSNIPSNVVLMLLNAIHFKGNMSSLLSYPIIHSIGLCLTWYSFHFISRSIRECSHGLYGKKIHIRKNVYFGVESACFPY